MKLGNWLVTLVLALAMVACSAGGKPWTGDPQLVHKLQLKMSEAEVRDLLGEPSQTQDMDMLGVKQQMWNYNGSQRVMLLFQNGKLVNASLGGTTVLEAGVGDI
ncbi:outer membrane protein assembly factor BamE [Cognatiluteimonas telluris]|jgi:hypothetical protein|uniref:outer membrane protein assembly factor BamE n=1 Tax=Cognatiluteimonas telluris TaxID=1104775 RepID=UPI00140D7DAD|nr:outer membrane protein assembly factor BamE [Lysobacter telluris]